MTNIMNDKAGIKKRLRDAYASKKSYLKNVSCGEGTVSDCLEEYYARQNRNSLINLHNKLSQTKTELLEDQKLIYNAIEYLLQIVESQLTLEIVGSKTLHSNLAFEHVNNALEG
jgi:hypothetical protein